MSSEPQVDLKQVLLYEAQRAAMQQVIDDLDAAQAYVSSYIKSQGDAEQSRMVESLKRASSILCLLSDEDISLAAQLEKLRALDLCSVCGNTPLASGRECVCAGTGTADGERHGLRIEAIRARQEAEELKEIRADDKRVLTENYNALWSLVYPDDPTGWEYPGQIINHLKLFIEEKESAVSAALAEVGRLRSAIQEHQSESSHGVTANMKFADDRLYAVLSAEKE